jgi:hypothetical protein
MDTHSDSDGGVLAELDADEISDTDLPALSVSDRCDAPDCDSQAYVRALLKTGLQLTFCGHHGRALIPGLAAQGASIRDDSELLRGDRRLA